MTTQISIPRCCEVIFRSDGAKFYLKCPYNREMIRENFSWLNMKKKWNPSGSYWEVDEKDFDDCIEILNDYFGGR